MLQQHQQRLRRSRPGGCQLAFNNASGSTASVSKVVVNLGGSFTRPPNGVYTHGYAKMNNTFGISASIQLDGNVTGQSSGTGMAVQQ